jgi:hypothetical protein
VNDTLIFVLVLFAAMVLNELFQRDRIIEDLMDRKDSLKTVCIEQSRVISSLGAAAQELGCLEELRKRAEAHYQKAGNPICQENHHARQ